MKDSTRYNIDIFRLSNKSHEYEFEIGDAFFEKFEQDYIEKGNLFVKVKLEKSDTMITADFSTKGIVELTCDRSLEKFDYPIDTHNRIIFKFGDEEKEISDEIFIITHSTQRLELEQHIFDFIALAVPMKKLHPRFEEHNGGFDEGETVEGVLIYTTPADTNSSEESGADSDNQDIDPRWAILKNLKNNNN